MTPRVRARAFARASLDPPRAVRARRTVAATRSVVSDASASLNHPTCARPAGSRSRAPRPRCASITAAWSPTSLLAILVRSLRQLPAQHVRVLSRAGFASSFLDGLSDRAVPVRRVVIARRAFSDGSSACVAVTRSRLRRRGGDRAPNGSPEDSRESHRLRRVRLALHLAPLAGLRLAFPSAGSREGLVSTPRCLGRCLIRGNRPRSLIAASPSERPIASGFGRSGVMATPLGPVLPAG